MEARQTSTPHDLRLMLSSAGFEASVLEKLGVQGEEGSEAVQHTGQARAPGPRLFQDRAVDSEC